MSLMLSKLIFFIQGTEAGEGGASVVATTQVQAALLPAGAIQVPAGGAATLKQADGAVDKPPKYEDAAGSEGEKNGQKYQRFG